MSENYGSTPSFKVESFSYDALHGGGMPIFDEPTTVAQGEILPRGAVLGRVTATGLWVQSVAAAVDGSEVPRRVLAVAVDATDGDVDTAAYVAGDFIASALAYGAGHDAASVAAAWEGTPLFVVEAS